jgi:hypothetical protein
MPAIVPTRGGPVLAITTTVVVAVPWWRARCRRRAAARESHSLGQLQVREQSG